MKKQDFPPYSSVMDKWIDLTQLIDDGMPAYPGDDAVRVRKIKFLKKDKYRNYLLTSGMHTGTHIDGPAHLLESGSFLSDIAPERFSGKAVLMDVSGRGRDIRLTDEDFPSGDYDIIVFRTGWEQLWKTDRYYTEYPVFHESCTGPIIRRKIKMVLFDSPSPDRYPFPVHTGLLAEGMLIAENLVNLALLPEDIIFELFAFPLKIRTDSSPARILAKL